LRFVSNRILHLHFLARLSLVIATMIEPLRLRIHGGTAGPTLIYLPGMHGDWTLLGAFREALGGRARLVEVAYPRRSDWALEDYAVAVELALKDEGINGGWLLGESFSSQVAWALIQRSFDRDAPSTSRPSTLESEPVPAASSAAFEWPGLILVGGFIKHPWPWAVALAHRASGTVPIWLLKRACSFYAWSAGRRYRGSREICDELREFVARRSEANDRAAITSRYVLISQNDLRPIARRTALPVFHLSGAIDPLVPWWQVRPWLQKNCPGYRDSRILRRAGHNVFLGAARESAEQILRWIGSPGPDDRATRVGTFVSQQRMSR
jgi:pimeloyl-ACP methyl ester carboxylesterase